MTETGTRSQSNRSKLTAIRLGIDLVEYVDPLSKPSAIERARNRILHHRLGQIEHVAQARTALRRSEVRVEGEERARGGRDERAEARVEEQKIGWGGGRMIGSKVRGEVVEKTGAIPNAVSDERPDRVCTVRVSICNALFESPRVEPDRPASGL